MTKSKLIEALQNKMPHLAHRIVEDAAKSIVQYMYTSLSCGERVEVRRFGSFSLKYHKPRKNRNPKTGAIVNSPSKYSVHFEAGKELRERVNTDTHSLS